MRRRRRSGTGSKQVATPHSQIYCRQTSKAAVYCFLTYLPFCRLTFTPIFVSLQDISTSPRSKIFSKGKCCCKGLGVAQQMRKGPIENWKVVSHPRVPVVVIFPLEWVRQNKPSGTRRSCNNKSCQSDVRKKKEIDFVLLDVLVINSPSVPI